MALRALQGLPHLLQRRTPAPAFRKRHLTDKRFYDHWLSLLATFKIFEAHSPGENLGLIHQKCRLIIANPPLTLLLA